MSVKKICYVVIFISTAFFLFLPNLLSTRAGNKAINYILEQKFTKKIQFAKLHLSWIGPQKIQQFQFMDHNQIWFSCPVVTIDNSLLSLMSTNSPKNLLISEPELVWKETTPDSQKRLSLLHILAACDSLQITKGSFRGELLTYPNIQLNEINLSCNTRKDKKTLSLQASSLQKQIEGFITLESIFLVSKKTKPFFTPLTLTTDIENLPSNLLGFFTRDFFISSLLGSFFNLKLSMNNSSAEQLYSVNLTSPLLKVQGKARWDKIHRKFFADSIPLSCTLTQENYDYLRSVITLPKLHLIEPSIFQGLITQCIANTKDTEFFPLINKSELSFDIAFTNEKLQVAYRNEISHISSLEIKSHIFKNCISSQMQAKVSAKRQGAFFANISWSKQMQDAEIRCQSIPSYLLEGLVEGLSIDKLCGPTIDATLNAKFINNAGPISVECLSSYSSFFLEGQLQEKTITLSKPFYCQINKEAGNYICKELFPVFSCLQPKNPISFKIAARETIGFSDPFSFMHLTIPNIEIEIGKVLCHNQNVSNALFKLLKINLLKTSLTFDLWIAPINMHIDDGLIALDRTEILLIDLYEIAIWGQADIRKTLWNMKLGLPASTLSKAFKIPGLLDNYVLILKLEGNLENPKINLKEAIAKISTLFVCQQENTTPLPIFFPSCKSLNKSSAPPAKHPFPWEQTTVLTKDKKRKKFKQKEKPLKQLLKVLR